MADPLLSQAILASGLPSAVLASAAARPAPEKARPAKTADPQLQGQDSLSASKSATTPEAAMEQINVHLQQAGTELRFQVDNGSGRTIFQVVSPSSGKVLLQVPSDEMLAMARNLRAVDRKLGVSGVLVDKEG